MAAAIRRDRRRASGGEGVRSFARITTASVLRAAATLVDVQASVSEKEGGDSTFRSVGLPDSALRE